MTANLVGQVVLVPSTLGAWVVTIIVIAAIVAVLYIILQQMNVQIPPFVVKIFWVLVAAIVGILAIVFLLRLGGLA